MDGNTPVGIIAADKDKKISIKKALRAASKKVVVEWPSYLYSHIKEIRKGYNESNKFRNSQILIRPTASNNKLVISNRQTSNDRWEYVETLSFPLNPSDIDKFGQKRQTCKSSFDDVSVNFLDAKEYCKNIPNSNIDPLSNSFQPAKNGVPSVSQLGTPRASTPTRNRFEGLSESHIMLQTFYDSKIKSINSINTFNNFNFMASRMNKEIMFKIYQNKIKFIPYKVMINTLYSKKRIY